MSEYVVATDPADNISLRPLYGQGIALPFEGFFVKKNGVPISAWVMRNTTANRARYDAIYDSTTPPSDRSEALARAGATFFPRWYQSEMLRNMQAPSQTTKLAFKNLPRTTANIAAAERELRENTRELSEDYLAEEWRTLAWVREEMGREREEEREDDARTTT